MFPFFSFMPTFTISFDGTHIEPRYPWSGKVEQSWLVKFAHEIGLTPHDTTHLLLQLTDKKRGAAGWEVSTFDAKQEAAIDRMRQVIAREQALLK